MLRPGDAQVVERDPSIPGLRTLLDDEAFAAILRDMFPDAGVGAAAARYVRYKAGTSCLVAFDVDAATGQIQVYARAHRREAAGKLQGADKRAVSPGVLGEGRCVHPDLHLVVHVFPNDHELTGLPLLHDPAERAVIVRRLVRDRVDLRQAPMLALRYKPERRFVGLIGDRDQRAIVVKCYDDEGFRVATERAGLFRTTPDARVPAPAGSFARRRIMAWDWIAGPSVSSLALGGEGDLPARLCGRAIASLHAQTPILPGAYEPEQVSESMRVIVRDATALAPRLGERAAECAAALEPVLASLRLVRAPLHGDFSPEQVVMAADGRPALLDFDRAATGHPAYDLGTFAARLEHAGLRGALTRDTAERASAALIEGYLERAGSDAAPATRTFTAAALLLLALEPFRYRAPDWPDRTGAILTRTLELAGRESVPR